jgi:MFS family permease
VTAVPTPAPARLRRHTFGFWAVTLAFLASMGLATVPTPLYVLYQQRDHFSTIMVTVVFAVYSGGTVVALFFGGHLSDRFGRKPVLVCSLLVNVVSALIFVVAPSLPGMLVGRIVCGASVGLTTPTAAAFLAELHAARPAGARAPRRGQVVATAANLGGFGLGPLAAGLLAQFAPQPLRLPYLVFIAALLLLAVLIAFSPETALAPDPKPRYRPQRIVVPRHARGTFFAATATGMAAFAVYGIFTSLTPTFLAHSLHEKSHAVAGAVVFACFAAAAGIQILMSRAGLSATLRTAPLILIPGLALLVAGMWAASLVLFVLGGVLVGAGAALAFRSGLTAAAATAPPQAKAEVLAAYFLGSYFGLSAPAVTLGVATEHVSARGSMLVFALIVAAAIVLCTRMLRRGGATVSGHAG